MSLADLFTVMPGAGALPAHFVSVSLAGPPVPKGRPRFRYVKPNGARPGFVTTYTPKETEQYETAIRWKAKAAMKGRKPLEGPLAVRIFVMLPVPKSWSNKQRDAALTGMTRPISRGDFDNYAKAVCDSLNKIVYLDDSQIVTALIVKEYAERPGIIAEIFELP